jgi:dienelactone hydrolase
MLSVLNANLRGLVYVALAVASAECSLKPAAYAQTPTTNPLWNMEQLSVPPAAEPTDGYGVTDLKAVFLTGEPLNGKPTKVYAYVGLPPHASKESPVPGVVCVHGGGGTAFAEWVRIWNAHGFAAISLDTNGAVPKILDGEPDNYRHEWAGPIRYGFDQGNSVLRDQWPYHAVAAIARANSYLRSLPEVDASNVGITGISWGGYLTCLAASVDPRFKFAVPVYGCGFLDQGPTWSGAINDYGHDRWMQHWDPSSHLAHVECPMLWVNGTNDRHYYLPMFQQSYRLPTGPRSLSVRVRMEHGNTAGWSPPEIYEFAKAAVGKGTPLVQITGHSGNARVASAKYQAPSDTAVESAELVYTLDRDDWYDRNWQTADAKVDADRSQVSAKFPADVAVYYFNLRDNRGLTVSSEHVVVPPAGEPSTKNPR